jgi:hypothetical protein
LEGSLRSSLELGGIGLRLYWLVSSGDKVQEQLTEDFRCRYGLCPLRVGSERYRNLHALQVVASFIVVHCPCPIVFHDFVANIICENSMPEPTCLIGGGAANFITRLRLPARNRQDCGRRRRAAWWKEVQAELEAVTAASTTVAGAGVIGRWHQVWKDIIDTPERAIGLSCRYAVSVLGK